MKKVDKSEAATLRQKAEVKLKKNQSKINTPSSEQDIRKIAHELQVHQIELEIQNEELILANELAVSNAEKYIELYDFAPSGYFTLSREGKIIRLNLKAASMLGKERQRLVNSMFGFFVSDDSREAFNLFLSKVFKGKKNESCEVTLPIGENNLQSYIYITGMVSVNAEQCQLTIVDITEQKLTQRALLESEERFKMLFDKAPLGYQSLDIDGNFIDVNQQWLDTLGYTHDEVIGKWFGDFLSPAYQDGFRKRFPIFIAQGHIHSEFEMVHKNGNKLFIAFEGKIGYDNNGEFKQTHCILQDITERNKWVDALHKSEAKHSALISNISDVIGIISAEGIMMYKSSNIEKWFGWQPQDLVGTDGFSNVHPDDLERVKTEFFTVLEKEDLSITLEFRYKCKDGSYKPIELTAKNLINDPIINGVLLNYHDITERKQAENSLRESEKRFRTIFYQSPIAMALFDTEGHTIISNLPLSDMVGYSNDELSKIMVADFTYHEDADKDMNQFIELIEGRISNYRMEKRYIHKNGNIVWGNLYVTVIHDENGTSKEIIGMVVDITERKKAEKALKETNEMMRNLYQRLENIREDEQVQISRNIHDHLGQSLTSLKFDLGTLADKTERGSKDNVKLTGMIEMVTQIIRNVQQISSELRPPALDELGLSAAMEWYCEEFMERTGLQLHLELDNVQTENLNKNLALYRVLQESLTNVIRHAGAKNVFIKLCILGEDVLLIIKDDGIGITPDKINSVKSLGILGMIERMRQFGGDIEISNPDKKGTEVKVRLSVK